MKAKFIQTKPRCKSRGSVKHYVTRFLRTLGKQSYPYRVLENSDIINVPKFNNRYCKRKEIISEKGEISLGGENYSNMTKKMFCTYPVDQSYLTISK